MFLPVLKSLKKHIEPLLTITKQSLHGMRCSEHCHGLRVSRLHEHRSRSRESTHQALTRRQVADNAAGCDTLEVVLAIPRYQMAVVDDVSLSFAELKSQVSSDEHHINTTEESWNSRLYE